MIAAFAASHCEGDNMKNGFRLAKISFLSPIIPPLAIKTGLHFSSLHTNVWFSALKHIDLSLFYTAFSTLGFFFYIPDKTSHNGILNKSRPGAVFGKPLSSSVSVLVLNYKRATSWLWIWAAVGKTVSFSEPGEIRAVYLAESSDGVKCACIFINACVWLTLAPLFHLSHTVKWKKMEENLPPRPNCGRSSMA